jgi:hypothetical protein
MDKPYYTQDGGKMQMQQMQKSCDASADVKDSIEQALMIEDKVLAECESTYEVLRAKLDPIIIASPCKPEAHNAKDKKGSSVRQRIDTHSERISELSLAMRSLINSLDL